MKNDAGAWIWLYYDIEPNYPTPMKTLSNAPFKGTISETYRKAALSRSHTKVWFKDDVQMASQQLNSNN